MESFYRQPLDFRFYICGYVGREFPFGAGHAFGTRIFLPGQIFVLIAQDFVGTDGLFTFRSDGLLVITQDRAVDFPKIYNGFFHQHVICELEGVIEGILQSFSVARLAYTDT